MDESIHSINSSLLSKARKQDREAWDRLVDVYGPLVFRWCLKKGLLSEQAKDISQDVFLVVSQKLGDYTQETFRGWLRRITYNKIIDFWRKDGKQPRPKGGTDNYRDITNIPAQPELESPEVEGEEEQFFGLSLIQTIRSEFSEQDLRAFYHTKIVGKLPAAVAEEMKITTNIVYLAASRILRRLKEIAGETRFK